MPLIRAFLVALMLCAPAAARDLDGIRQSGQLIVCANKNAMPISGTGDRPGFQMEIAQEIAKELGVRLSVEWIWAGYQARYTDCDLMLGVARDPKPASFLRYLQALTDVQVILVFAGAPRDVVLEDLADKVVAVPSASLAHFKLLEIGADPRVAYKSEVAILRAIEAGELDAGVVSSVALDWYRHDRPGAALFALSTDILDVTSHYPLTIALRHTDALDEADYHEIAAKMRDDGRLQAILARYGQTLSAEFDNPYARVPDEISEPDSVSVRKDIVEELEDLARRNREELEQSAK